MSKYKLIYSCDSCDHTYLMSKYQLICSCDSDRISLMSKYELICSCDSDHIFLMSNFELISFYYDHISLMSKYELICSRGSNHISLKMTSRFRFLSLKKKKNEPSCPILKTQLVVYSCSSERKDHISLVSCQGMNWLTAMAQERTMTKDRGCQSTNWITPIAQKKYHTDSLGPMHEPRQWP